MKKRKNLTTAFLEPFVHAALLLDQFVAHALLIAVMRVCLTLQHMAFGALPTLHLGLTGLILGVGESVAIALLILWSLPRESAYARMKAHRPTARKQPRWGVTRRRHGTRPCACRARKRKK